MIKKENNIRKSDKFIKFEIRKLAARLRNLVPSRISGLSVLLPYFFGIFLLISKRPENLTLDMKHLAKDAFISKFFISIGQFSDFYL